MASAMASAATRNIPHQYTIPVGPRVRPPRLLPGTKAANTDPKPNEPPPTKGDVWVQGKWRSPGSRAARDQREAESIKVEKALRHATHGTNIYAYSHIRTNQVVYSLTRVMQNNKMLSQLLYHGKQTVPSSLRRDAWRPYFSMHFSQTPAGAEAGLKAFRRLRELSVLRQLSPSPELIIATEADVQKVKNKYLPSALKKKLEEQSIKDLPVEGNILPKKHRARKLMDQKASSVADAAWVLGFMNKELSPAEELDAVVENRAKKQQQWSARAMRRLNNIRQKEATKDARIKAKQESTQAGRGHLGLTPHAARRIALEHGGAFTVPSKGMEFGVNGLEAIESHKQSTNDYISNTTQSQALLAGEVRPAEFDAEKYRARYVEAWKDQHGDSADGPVVADVESAVKKEQDLVQTQIAEFDSKLAETKTGDTQMQRNQASRTVQVLWADMRDATWAEQWPSNVYHGELESRAAIKREKSQLQQNVTTIDQEGNEVDFPAKKVVVQNSTTPHVFGNNTQSNWYENPEQMSEKRQGWRDTKMTEWKDSRLQASREILDSVEALHLQRGELQKKKVKLQPEFDALKRVEARSERSTPGREAEFTSVETVVQNLTKAERKELRGSMTTVEQEIITKDREIREMQQSYPSLYQKASAVIDWRLSLQAYTRILKIRDEIEGLDFRSLYESQDPQTCKRVQEIDLELSSYADAHPTLANNSEVQATSTSQVTKIIRNVRGYEQRVAKLESIEQSPEDEALLQDAQAALNNERRLLKLERNSAFDSRQDTVRNTLESLEEIFGNDITDLLSNRMHLEQQNNTDAIEEIDQQLKEHGDRMLMDLIGLSAPEPETSIQEYDEKMREKGVEAPPPPKRGIFGRIKGMFGR